MILENLAISDFLGIVIFMPLLIYLTLIVLDGIGIFRDIFFTSNRRIR